MLRRPRQYLMASPQATAMVATETATVTATVTATEMAAVKTTATIDFKHLLKLRCPLRVLRVAHRLAHGEHAWWSNEEPPQLWGGLSLGTRQTGKRARRPPPG